jgi:hypothetical protein
MAGIESSGRASSNPEVDGRYHSRKIQGANRKNQIAAHLPLFTASFYGIQSGVCSL